MPSISSVRISDLLVQAQGGNPKALEQIFTGCRNYLDVLARALVDTWIQAKVDSSDLVQQTLLEAFRGFQGFHGTSEAEWLAWLRRILENNATDFARQYAGAEKRQIRREVAWHGAVPSASSSFGGPDPIGMENSPSQELLRKERELLVADALTHLSPDHKEVILLRNLERLSFEEVAQRMSRSRPAVQMLWIRAIHRLQEEMAHLGQLVED
jgi:RNA polymerase sigma-70 factor (ECF subfamily)